MARTDRIAEPWGTRTPYGPGEPWPPRVDTHLAEGLTEADVDRWVQSASILHSNGDVLDIAVEDGSVVGVRGRAVDRVNRGRLDPEDLFGWQATNSRERLTRPLVRRGGELVETDRDTAVDLVVRRTRELLDEQGPSAATRRTCARPAGPTAGSRSPRPRPWSAGQRDRSMKKVTP
jgi:anaerobic selenocysteine-containing dehydrogenase